MKSEEEPTRIKIKSNRLRREPTAFPISRYIAALGSIARSLSLLSLLAYSLLSSKGLRAKGHLVP